MRRIVTALFHSEKYPVDEQYVRRRYEASIAPGAWEALAAARFRRPGADAPPAPSSRRAYKRISIPALVIEGGSDKLLPRGWAAEIAAQLADARHAVVPEAGHCPQIEQPEMVNELLLTFLDEQSRTTTEPDRPAPLRA
jgi:pimeloyl-ACP methyl ester carboxylesterase